MAKRVGWNLEGGSDFSKKRRTVDIPSVPTRSIFIGNIPTSATSTDLCKIANTNGGPLEQLKMYRNKHTAFLNFVNETDAFSLYAQYQQTPYSIHGQQLTIGWAKSSPIPADVKREIDAGATRSLFIGGVCGDGWSIDENMLRSIFSAYGDVESVLVLHKKKIAFVNLTSIKSAITAVKSSREHPISIGGRILSLNFAKEVAFEPAPSTSSHFVSQYQPTSLSHHLDLTSSLNQQRQLNFALQQRMSSFLTPSLITASTLQQSENNTRAIFIGSLAEETSYHELCKLGNKFGAIEKVLLNREKKNAFINYVSNAAAVAMFTYSQNHPIIVCGKVVRINWAKSTPLHNQLMEQTRAGATRNLYIGGLPETATEEDIKELFVPFCNENGEFDNIVLKKARHIAFVNFTSLKDAIYAKKAFETSPAVLGGLTLKINYAKECSNPQWNYTNSQNMSLHSGVSNSLASNLHMSLPSSSLFPSITNKETLQAYYQRQHLAYQQQALSMANYRHSLPILQPESFY